MAMIHRKSLHVLGQILLELMLVMPAVLLIAMYASPGWSHVGVWMAVVTGSALLGFMIQTIFPVKKENLWLIIYFICVAGFYYVTGLPHGIQGVILYVFGYTAFARGFKAASSPRQAVHNSNIYALGIAAHAFIFLISTLYAEWEKLQPLLAVVGIIALFGVAYLLNHKQLGKVNYSDTSHVSVPQYVRHMNRRYVLIFLGSIFILGLLLFSSLMDGLWRLLRQWLNSLLSTEAAPPPEQVEDTAVGSFNFFPAGEEPSTNPIWIWLEKIAVVAFTISFIGGVILLMVWLFRKLIKRWFPQLWELLRRLLTQERTETAGMDYEDEQFSLLQWDKLKNELKLPLNNLIRRMKHRSEKMSDYQTSRDRIRFLYRSRVREAAAKGYAPQQSLTPKETLAEIAKLGADAHEKEKLDQLAEAYNAARYGEEEPKDGTLQLLYFNKHKK